MDTGQIYCLTSPSSKQYVGQCVKVLSNGKNWGYMNRWKQHIRDAHIGRDYCRLLNNAIRKYGSETFLLELLMECSLQELDFYENHYIEHLQTMSPNGYNLISGKTNSRQSDETKERRRASMMGENSGKVLSRRNRKRSEDSILPKYLRYYQDSSGKEGYRVTHHPQLSDKSFFGKNISMEDKLQNALTYLSKADIR